MGVAATLPELSERTLTGTDFYFSLVFKILRFNCS